MGVRPIAWAVNVLSCSIGHIPGERGQTSKHGVHLPAGNDVYTDSLINYALLVPYVVTKLQATPNWTFSLLLNFSFNTKCVKCLNVHNRKEFRETASPHITSNQYQMFYSHGK